MKITNELLDKLIAEKIERVDEDFLGYEKDFTTTNFNAKNRGRMGASPGATPSDQEGGGSRPTYSTPAANAAIQQLGNTNTGILKK